MMPDLYARATGRRTTARYDEVTVDVMERGLLAEREHVVHLRGHVVRVPRFATDGEVVVLLAAEITRLELGAELPDARAEKQPLSPGLQAARPDRSTGAEMVRALRETGRFR